MATPALGQLIASVFEKVAGAGPEDNIFTSQFLLWYLKENGGFRQLDGGRLIEETLDYAENSSFKSYSDLETLDTTRYDTVDAARYDWKEIGGTIVISNLERLRAQGDSAKFDLAAHKVNNAKSSMTAVLNRQFYSDGTGNSSKDIGGLALLISSTPTSGTVGGINRATFSWWRNRQVTGTKASAAFDNLRSKMLSCYNQCSKGAFDEHPTGIVTSRAVFEGYEGLLTANERYTSKSSGDAGFKNEVLKYKGAMIAFDEDCGEPSSLGQMFFFNTKNMKYNYPKGGWMKSFPPVTPANQTAEIVKLVCVGNMSTNNSRRLGVVSGISLT